MKSRLLWACVAGWLTLAAWPQLAGATVMRPLTLDDIVRKSELIVHGEVTSVRAAWDADHRRIYTTVEIAPRRALKGELEAGGPLRVRVLGGVVGDIEMAIAGSASFTQGEEVVVALTRGRHPRTGAREHYLVGMRLGKLRVERGKAGVMLTRSTQGISFTSDVPPQPTRFPLADLEARVRKLRGVTP